eukprot:4820921-Prymnesium_polylepis.1
MRAIKGKRGCQLREEGGMGHVRVTWGYVAWSHMGMDMGIEMGSHAVAWARMRSHGVIQWSHGGTWRSHGVAWGSRAHSPVEEVGWLEGVDHVHVVHRLAQHMLPREASRRRPHTGARPQKQRGEAGATPGARPQREVQGRHMGGV